MKKFTLKKWYPRLPEWVKIGAVARYSKRHECYFIAKYYSIQVSEVENNPDFWELIEDKNPLFDSLCNHAGFGDLKPADRSGDKPLQRQAVWCVMREQGIKFKEIAEQSHRTHGTVVVGVKRFKDFLSVKDEESVRMYQNVVKVAQNGKE